MGTRFRKRISILPWLKLNISKSGFSTTIGPKGFNVDVGSKGSFLNTGIPGTGFYSRNKLAFITSIVQNVSGGSWKQTEVDKFWEHRNKDGQKDYRYKNNKELSIVRYIALEIASHIIIFDDVNAALDFNRKLSNFLCLQGISIPELV